MAHSISQQVIQHYNQNDSDDEVSDTTDTTNTQSTTDDDGVLMGKLMAQPTAEFLEELRPTMQGWAVVQGKRMTQITWNLRWVVLNQIGLSFYKQPSDTVPRHSIFTKKIQTVLEVGTSDYKIVKRKKTYKFAFKVTYQSTDNSYNVSILACESHLETENWISAIKTSIGEKEDRDIGRKKNTAELLMIATGNIELPTASSSIKKDPFGVPNGRMSPQHELSPVATPSSPSHQRTGSIVSVLKKIFNKN